MSLSRVLNNLSFSWYIYNPLPFPVCLSRMLNSLSPSFFVYNPLFLNNSIMVDSLSPFRFVDDGLVMTFLR